MRQILRVLCALSLISASACELTGHRGSPCGAFGRFTTASAVAIDERGHPIVTADVRAVDYLETSTADIGLNVFGQSSVTAGPLQGHVSGARIVDVDGTDVLAPGPIEPVAAGQSGGALLRYVDFPVADAAAFAAIRAKMLASALVLVIETDLAPFEHLRLPLQLKEASDFKQPLCL